MYLYVKCKKKSIELDLGYILYPAPRPGNTLMELTNAEYPCGINYFSIVSFI